MTDPIFSYPSACNMSLSRDSFFHARLFFPNELPSHVSAVTSNPYGPKSRLLPLGPHILRPIRAVKVLADLP